jgi:hypothetical protein
MRLALIVVLASCGSLPAGEPAAVDYLRDVKPLLARRCYACHGALKQKGGLRLDTAASMRAGGDSGPAIEPGQAQESYLIAAVTGDAGFRMPPEGEPLSADEIDRLRAWIDTGAAAPADEAPQQDPSRHWSFRPPVRPPVPAHVQDPAWLANPIDAFLAAEHDKRGLTHRPPADRATLLRRVSLDLTGLAPTPEELHAFLNDNSNDAYEKAVERLLASPRYGERWGRHWMDVWRYSDWAGFGAEVRESQPHIWRWRDWIVESLNEDKPYDRMVREMIAGDELAPEDPDTVRATGYLVRNWYKFNRNSWIQNTVDHTAKAFLGITLACARCHDHKYDPFEQTDWYRFRAFFEPHDIATDRVPGQPDPAKDGLVRVYDAKAAEPTYLFRRGNEKEPDKEHPLTPAVPKVLGSAPAITPVALPPPAYYPALQPTIRKESLAAAETAVIHARELLAATRKTADELAEKAATLAARLDAGPALVEVETRRKKAEADVTAAERGLAAALAGVESVKARIAADDAKFAPERDSKRADMAAIVATHAERRAKLAEAEAALAKAQAATLAAPTGDDAKAKQARAEAFMKEDLASGVLATARKTFEGPHSTAYTPLAPPRPPTSTGRRTALAAWMTSPENPLAARVAVNHIWMRHFGSPLVPTVFDFGSNGKPPTHPELLDWLAVELMEHGWSMKHLHRLMVTSQAYRMQSWSEPGDPSAKLDPQNVALWRMNARRMEAELVRDNVLFVAGSLDPAMSGPEIDQNAGLTNPRRSLYFRHAPEKLMTFLKLFDAANTNACYRRDESVVPQQALALANSPLSLGEARKLAGLLARSHGDPDGFIAAAFERVLSRAPTPDEQAACAEYLAEQTRRLASPSGLTPFTEGPAPAVPPSNDPAQRARENLVHVLMNHNDFVTVR